MNMSNLFTKYIVIFFVSCIQNWFKNTTICLNGHYTSVPDHLFFCFVDAGSGSGDDGEYFQLISN